ncbi:MAG: tetratricopeptide repeat protein [Syntrophobacteraceae bacterium]
MCTFRIATKDADFVQSDSAFLFPTALLINGKIKYYSTLNPPAAAESFKKAILAEPSLLDAWMALARTEVAMGHREEAERILGIVSPTMSSLSSWKWEELLLAFDLRDEKHFQDCFNFILSYLPHRVREASWLGALFWGSWKDVLPHLSSSNYPVFLTQLMAAREPDVALTLWKMMTQEDPNIPDKDKLQFCQYLIANDRLQEAKNIWKLRQNGDLSNITDGGFELQPLNTAFGWQFPAKSDVIIERTTDQPYAGRTCLHLHFKGTTNISLGNLFQIVPVQPETRYWLRFARKSRNITTDRGVFLDVGGYKCKGLAISSQPILGTSPWTEEEMEFVTPAGCEAVMLRICRSESLKFDNKISGDYWLDAVELMKQ